MSTSHAAPSGPQLEAPGASSSFFASAGRFWEPRRVIYNLVLAAIVITWIAASWPHFRPAMNLGDLLRLLGLAAIANLLYSAAYLIDWPLQSFAPQRSLGRMRWALWVAGMLLAILLTNYWIADEIYPYVS
jgi:hypothetical protein